jgi:hypothetical protein
MGPPALNPGESPDVGVSAPEAQPASRRMQATAMHTTERFAPARRGTVIVPLYIGLMVERLPFLSDRYETVTVTVSMYTVFDGCCPAGPALGSATGILAIRLTTPSPFTT